MSKRADVAFAILNLIATALPGVEVVGLNGDANRQRAAPPGGRVIVESGDPGEPDIDLSPLTYHYDHGFPVELIFAATEHEDSEIVVDRAIEKIGLAIEQDRHLGDHCAWIEATAPITGDETTSGAGRPARGAQLVIVASYSTTSPLN